MSKNMTLKKIQWRVWAIFILPSLFLGTVVAAGYFATLDQATWTHQALSTSAGGPVNWSPAIVPSTLSYGIKHSYQNMTDGQDIVLSTSMPVTTTNMTFENVTVKNISLMLETYSSFPKASDNTYQLWYFQQLKIPASCYLPWVSLYIQCAQIASTAKWRVSIFNATNNFPDPRPVPHMEIPNSNVSINPKWDGPGIPVQWQVLAHWENITIPHVLLNASNTICQDGFYHFFIAVLMPRLDGTLHFWYYAADNEGDGVDAGTAWYSISSAGIISGPGTNLRLYTREIPYVDFTLITKLVPMNRQARPTAIGLKVNGELVASTGNGTGYLSSTTQLIPANDQVRYTITSAWSDLSANTLTYDVDCDFELGQEIIPVVQASVSGSGMRVDWQMNYVASFVRPSGIETAQLRINIPHTWTTIQLFNTTAGGHVLRPSTLTLAPTGKYQQFLAASLTPGTWQVTGRSPLLPAIANLILNNETADLDTAITGDASVPGGPNGRNESLQTEYEGGISDISIYAGDANSTSKSALSLLDGESIRFKNSTGKEDLLDILTRIYSGNYYANFNIEDGFDLSLNLPEGFKEENIHDLELVLNHEGFNGSWWFGNATNSSIPENEAYMNARYNVTEELFSILLFYDFDVVLVNFSYIPAKQRYADMYTNYSCSITGKYDVPREAIQALEFNFASNFSRFDNTQTVYIKNQTSGTFIQLLNVENATAIMNDTALHWDSRKETTIRNITEFISPFDNVAEFMVRTTNKTFVDYVGKDLDYYIDQAVVNFTYANNISNLTIWMYNWTSDSYTSANFTMFPVAGVMSTRIDLKSQFGDVPGIFNETTGSVRLMVESNAMIPVFNEIWWGVDRMMLNMTFTKFDRCTWNQTVYNQAEVARITSIDNTLFDAPTNNHSISFQVNDVVDYCDNYTYEMLWSNGSDVALAQIPFRINRYAVRLELTAGIGSDILITGSMATIEVTLSHATNGTAIAGKALSMVLHATYRNGTTHDVPFAGLTDENGVSRIGFEALSDWQSFTYTVNYNDVNPRFKNATLDVTTITRVLTPAENASKIFMDNLVIIIVAAAVIVITGIVRRSTDVKKKRRWKSDANTIRDVVKIQHLMVIMKSSGMCIVDRSYSQMQLDGDLISGFLHAIATFGKEVGGRGTSDKNTKEGIVFDYQDFKILLQEGNNIRLALILNGVPTENLKAKAEQFISTFEVEYNLQDWRGNLDAFAGVDNFIEQAFEITLIYPLVVNAKKTKKQVKSGLGKAL
nr:hypothetical protein [Candidatus Sigynarchaeota archaeon]